MSDWTDAVEKFMHSDDWLNAGIGSDEEKKLLASFASEVERLTRQEGWVSVEERKPKIGQVRIVAAGPDHEAQWMGLTWDGEKFMWSDAYEYGESAFDPFPTEQATHWQPFPADPPKCKSVAVASSQGGEQG